MSPVCAQAPGMPLNRKRWMQAGGRAARVKPQAMHRSFTCRELWGLTGGPSDYIWDCHSEMCTAVPEKPIPTMQAPEAGSSRAWSCCSELMPPVHRGYNAVVSFHSLTHRSRHYSTSHSRHRSFLDSSSCLAPSCHLLTAISDVPGDLWLCYPL